MENHVCITVAVAAEEVGMGEAYLVVLEVASSWAVQVEASLVDRRGPSWAVQEVASSASPRVPSSVDLEGPSSWAILVSGTSQVEAFCCHTKPED